MPQMEPLANRDGLCSCGFLRGRTSSRCTRRTPRTSAVATTYSSCMGDSAICAMAFRSSDSQPNKWRKMASCFLSSDHCSRKDHGETIFINFWLHVMLLDVNRSMIKRCFWPSRPACGRRQRHAHGRQRPCEDKCPHLHGPRSVKHWRHLETMTCLGPVWDMLIHDATGCPVFVQFSWLQRLNDCQHGCAFDWERARGCAG